jgi:hypothetical protein
MGRAANAAPLPVSSRRRPSGLIVRRPPGSALLACFAELRAAVHACGRHRQVVAIGMVKGLLLRQVQRFLSIHDQAANVFSRRPTQDVAVKFHIIRNQKFTTWAEATGVTTAAWS